MEDVKGRVHSIETFSTVDGPGIRSVIFLQGCPLRCQYCHNPDTWATDAGQEKSAKEIIDFLERYRGYYKASGGGITISGGEPCLQPLFTKALMQECKKRGLHVALDTSGWVSSSVLKDLLQYADLVLLDIKHVDPTMHRQLTGKDNAPALQAGRLISQAGIPLWVRHVLIPGVTDDAEHLMRLAEFLRSLATLQRVDILPYHRMGEHKWQELGLAYTLEGITPPSKEQLAAVKELFRRYRLPVDGVRASEHCLQYENAC
jgi:pyruvate formate lyase activating enzyme